MTLNCNGKILDLKIPKVMGILNLAPDSFYDGGKYKSVKSATQRCSEMLTQGADIIDIGAASSRPGAQIISEKEEVTLIDFPQMVSTNHENARMYFERDAKGLWTFFNKKLRRIATIF